MPTAPALKVKITGPIKNHKKTIKKGVNKILTEVGDAMVGDVRKQLYKPASFPRRRHGLVSGKLRSSVTWRKGRKFRNGRAELVVDTSKGHPGRNVPYTRWIEEGGRHPRWGTMTSFRGYSMFRRTATKFEKQKRVHSILMRGMVKELNG